MAACLARLLKGEFTLTFSAALFWHVHVDAVAHACQLPLLPCEVMKTSKILVPPVGLSHARLGSNAGDLCLLEAESETCFIIAAAAAVAAAA